MNKELIEARKAELQKALEQTQANGNALIGAIQECEYWLAKIASDGSEQLKRRLEELAQKDKAE